MSDEATRVEKPVVTIWQRAAYRWAAITGVLSVYLLIYSQHPYYLGATFAPWRPFFTGAFVVWLVLGVFYCKATLEKFHQRRYWMRDGGLLLLIIFRRLTERTRLPPRVVPRIAVVEAQATYENRFFRAFRGRRIRSFLRGIVVKAFFTPLMTGFFSGHATTIMDMWLRHKNLQPLKFQVGNGNALMQAKNWWTQLFARIPEMIPSGDDFSRLFTTWTMVDVKWSLDWVYNWVFLVDCGFALIGYATESRWMGNKTKSVEPTAFGWAICLCCYPPYNNVLGTYLPLTDGPRIITGETTAVIFKAATVLLFMIYASATVAFGFKFSNLTNRGIISRGPYRFVRHPAYLTKCSAWWLEHLPTMTITKAFFLTGLCGVYALRAWTEERHLSADPDYVAYKKKTPWVLFPGVY